MTKKILIAHSNLKAKRTLTLLLADAGFDIRAASKAPEAVELAKHELFDLAVIEQALRIPEPDMLGAIRREQPTLPVFLMAKDLALPAIIQAIRLGVADVFNQPEDFKAIVERIFAYLCPGQTFGGAEALGEIDTLPATAAGKGGAKAPAESGGIAKQLSTLKAELSKLSKEQSELALATENLRAEREALQGEVESLQLSRSQSQKVEVETASARTQLQKLQAEAKAAQQQIAEFEAEKAGIKPGSMPPTRAKPGFPRPAPSSFRNRALSSRRRCGKMS